MLIIRLIQIDDQIVLHLKSIAALCFQNVVNKTSLEMRKK